MMFDFIIGKWRHTKQHGRKSGEKSWLTYRRYYLAACKDTRFPSLREINLILEIKPPLARRRSNT